MLQLLPQRTADADDAEGNDPTAILDRALAEAERRDSGAEQHHVVVVGPRLDAARRRDAAVGRARKRPSPRPKRPAPSSPA